MSAETSPAQGFPTPCTRCGGVLYQHVDFCPYCGADHPLEPIQRKRAGTQLRAVDTQPPPLADIASDGTGISPLLSPDVPIPPLDVPLPLWQAAGRWIFTKGVVLLLFIFALGYAGYLLLGDHRQDTGSDEPTNSASTSGGSISPYTPPQTAHNAPSANVTNVPVLKTPAASVAVISPVVPAAPPPRAVQHYRNVPDALRAARTSLAHNSLADAKAALSDAHAIEPNNTEAMQMQSDLKDRENKRDVALGVANTCAKDKLWGCVRERASQALAIDTSSVEAQTLLERVILSTGWKPLTGAAAPSPRAATTANANVSANANANPAAAASTKAAPALPPLPPGMPSTNAATANTAANPAANAPATGTSTGNAASAVSSIDAQMRAIRESGWKHQPSSANKP
ncbi:zinc ribbon domain-containing protein [Paraburkholderia sp. Tr-20389]|uniref:zinc ribbon domain-containing protein n=1 Tax=Paraburkholderia sp. Tr-20389 TaxID=2703903 RepID=UPI00197EE721|nr:zinc ribbon domain-containing protein [Paraburkholderia sp. Tr-20389]MBN3756824.1 zinc ribbon domain-containing protein [Paraburkholderia sp. Tr-20389]